MGDMRNNTDLHLLENNNLITKYVLKLIFAKTAQHHKNPIPEPNDNIEFTCILHSVVIYIFKLEDSNVHDWHGELVVNETLIPSFSTKFTFALLLKMLSCGLTVMCKYTLTLTTNAKKKTSKKRSGKSKVINHSLDG